MTDGMPIGYPDNELHAMLDLETASSGYNAAVLSIGLLIFNPGTGEDILKKHILVPFSYYKNIQPGEVTLETIKWWMEQEAAAQRAAWVSDRAEGDHRFFADDIANLTSWFEKVSDIWANDPDFDCVILRNFLETKMGIKWRWYRKHRSLRTIKALFDIPPIEDRGIAHNALDDCLYQAEFVRAVYQGRAPLRIAQADPLAALSPALDSSIA